MKARLFIHAPNIHQGGGAVLLGDLLRATAPEDDVFVTVDERMVLSDEIGRHIKIKRVHPSLSARFMAERWLASAVTADDDVLCFGNLPPIFKLKAKVSVFLQNRYLLDRPGRILKLTLQAKLRWLMERSWLFLCKKNVDRFFVQTPEMSRLANQKMLGNVSLYPFVPDGPQQSRHVVDANDLKKTIDFVYIASGDGHKNHVALLEAWRYLGDENLFPSLSLTLNNESFPALVKQVEDYSAHYKLNIINRGNISHDEVLDLYRHAHALIYPSEFESFGIPLIEARQAGLKVLAPELDYVRDLLDPDQTFDPASPLSIARAVKRCLGIEVPPLELLDATSFLRHLQARGTQ
ncbi:glycosyltransferase [Herbaspirillum sp. NPDC101397]|uniref:glycosyltransferase n=1 Tax=Herbaspirillum sp. NPDC101397 TaxID=3364006 RepID=UPI00383B34DD